MMTVTAISFLAIGYGALQCYRLWNLRLKKEAMLMICICVLSAGLLIYL